MRRISLSRCALALAALAVLGSAPRVARASALPAIVWDAPPECPGVDVLRAEVARRIGADAAATVAQVRVRVERRADGWHLAVTLTDDSLALERSLKTESCEAATRAAAFIVAIAIDPAAGGPEAAPGPTPPALVPEPAPPAPAPPAPPAPAPRRPAIEPASPLTGAVTPAPAVAPAIEPGADEPAPRPSVRRRAPQGLLHLGPGLQVGMAPVGAGLAAAGGLLWPRLRLALGYVRWFPTRLPASTNPGLGGELSVHAANLRVGPVLRAGPLEFPLHLGLELGVLRAEGRGGDVNFTRHGLWGAATVGAGLAWAPRALRGHGALVLAGELALALHRPQLVFNDDILVHRIGAAAFRGQLMVEARFP